MFGKKLRNEICIHEEIASSLIWRNSFYHSGQYLLSYCVLSEKERSEIHNCYFLCCFYGCQNCSTALREDHKGKFWTKREKVTRELYNEELHNLCSYPNMK